MLNKFIMKVAVPHWQERVSPVFDVATHFLLVEKEENQAMIHTEQTLMHPNPYLRAAQLAGLGVEVVICAAISKPFQNALEAKGIQVIPRTCGPVQSVVDAFLNNHLQEMHFKMPGQSNLDSHDTR